MTLRSQVKDTTYKASLLWGKGTNLIDIADSRRLKLVRAKLEFKFLLELFDCLLLEEHWCEYCVLFWFDVNQAFVLASRLLGCYPLFLRSGPFYFLLLVHVK